MGIRETLNNNPKLVIRGTIVIIILALGYVVWYALPTPMKVEGPQEFYTDDDGVTWFADSSSKLAPFEHNSREAVLAKVYRCQNGTVFVGYMEKFSDSAKKRIADARSSGGMGAGNSSTAQNADMVDLLVKKPHDKTWVSARDPRAAEIETVRGPDGSNNCEPYLP